MTETANPKRHLLFTQLHWFAELRWLAGAAVIAAALLDWRWLNWYDHDEAILGVGVAVLLYNVALLTILPRLPRRWPQRRRGLFLLAWVQILLDMGCLTLLNLWTGGIDSPLRGFFVLHMVFASLLLPRYMAYCGALMAMLMYATGLVAVESWSQLRSDWLVLLGWASMLLLTVHLANHITRSLHDHRRRLIRQNRRVQAMSLRLRRHQESMIQNEKMVAMGQMAAGVAHEIANPLASMDSILQLIQRNPQRLRTDAVATLREQLSRIHQIVQQMTAFAHPTEGHRHVVPLNELVEAALQIVRFDPRLKGMQIDKSLDADAGEVCVPPQAIQQVVINLVINALDAVAGVPQPRVAVSTRRTGSTCIIEVHDNGHGIKPEHLSRLFEPFFTTKPVGKGTGLGLSISYSFVRKQGGQIEVKSQPGQGASFLVQLPAAAALSPTRESIAADLPVSEKR